MFVRKETLCPLRNHEAESTNTEDDLVIYCRMDCGCKLTRR